jgi:hypothetical protein
MKIQEALLSNKATNYYGFYYLVNGKINHHIGNRNNKEIWNGGKIHELMKIMIPISIQYPSCIYIIYKWDGISKENMCMPFDNDILELFTSKIEGNFLVFTTSIAKNLENIPKLRLLPTPYTLFYHQNPVYAKPSNWSSKISKAIWCGETSGLDSTCVNKKLRLLIYNIVKNNENFVYKFTSTDLKTPNVPIQPKIMQEEQLNYKLILCIDGWGWPGNLSWVLYSGCIPVIISDFNIGITKKMTPWIHYVPAKTDGSDLNQNVNRILKNECEAKRILRNLSQLMNQISTKKSIINELHLSMKYE